MTADVIADATVEHEAIARWIRERSQPLDELDPDGPLDDMGSMASLVGDATVVGLARPTHGARELTQLSHRVLRCLVEDLGFRTLAVEENWTTGIELDHTLQSESGDPRLALDHALPQWRNGEFLDVLRWMRTRNQHHPGDPVRLVGLDVTNVDGLAYDAIIDHVRRAAPDRLDTLHVHHRELRRTRPTATGAPRDDAHHDPAVLIDHARHVYDIVAALTDDRQQALTLQHARVIVQHHELNGTDAGSRMTYLEACLAENLAWWHEHTGHKILYWSGSHSAVGDARRVNFDASGGAPAGRNAGSHLREHFGARYLSGGCTLHHGSVSLGTSAHTLPAPRPGRPDAILDTAGLGSYLLSLRLDQPPPVHAWLQAPAKLRLLGGDHRSSDDADHHMTGGALADWFDFIIHRQHVTPTHTLEALDRRPHRDATPATAERRINRTQPTGQAGNT